MNNETQHIPVLKSELIKFLNIKKNGIYIDSTFGMGGHSKGVLEKLGKKGKLYAIDRDPNAIFFGKNIQDARFDITQENFSNLLIYAKKNNIIGKVDGIIFDLGMSSLQLDNYERGFSFKHDGPLDMRMNPSVGLSAADWLFNSNVKEICYVLKFFGEERFAKKISHAIKNRNKIKKITRTLELVDIIKKIIPIKNKFKHPAKRTFQAIRIYINQELQELTKSLEHAIKILKIGGRLSVISFHSLEDRIVKTFIMKKSQKFFVPYGMPVTEKQLKKLKICELKKIARMFPTEYEIKKNNRARSAILRIAEKK